jgi:hypothetical protein
MPRHIKQPGSGSGAYICDFGIRGGELDAGMNEKSECFAREDMLFIESIDGIISI